MLDLTIAIPVRNEAVGLPNCLAAIGRDLAVKVVVIDSGSTDETASIARSYGAEVVDFCWNGRFPKKRNWFLREHAPTTRWVLFLDADEVLTPEFKKELRAALPNASCVGFWLSYSVYFLGRPLKGGYPLRKLALFRVGAGEYERIDEERWSQLDMEVHEHPGIAGRVEILTSRIEHRDFRGVSHYVAKHNDYSSWEAARLRRTQEVRESTWTWKQRIKYRLVHSVWAGPVYFFGSFVIMGGFRDGARGLAFAMLKASYFTQIYCKLLEHRKASKDL